MKMLDGKIALITGGSSGIGRAAAAAFAREGANVIIADIMVEGSEETLALVRETGSKAIFIKADVTRAAEVETMIDHCIKTYGHLDCAFNNAGIGGGRKRTADTTEEEWDRMIEINLKGVWLCMKYEIPHMLAQGKGAIVNTSSVAGLIGFAGTAAYVASKHGVVGLTKSAALEYATSGVRINALCPGVINTPLIERNIAARPKLEEFYLNMHPIGRLGEAAEIAEAAVWLCSDAASFVTGHTMVVDGGMVAR